VFISDSENSQPIFWYESSDPRNGNWTAHQIAPTINFVHTSMVYDMDGDGDYDFIAGQNGDQVAGGKFVIYVNEGDNLTWTEQVIDNNGTYNSLVGDANGDGMWDIFRYKGHEDSRMDLFINEASALSPSSDSWKRYQIGSLGKEGLYVTAGDLDGDGDKDMAAAGNWWRNPGSLDGNWPQYTIGSPLNNVLLTHDFDNDGDLDILGSQGVGAESNNNFAWAENNGSGSFTVHTNIQSGGGDFAQGVAIADFGNGEQVMISWHNGANITLLTVPGSPASQTWSNSSLHNSSQDEDLSIGDIDDDGDLDVFQGTMWMENRGGSFVNHTIGSVPSGTPDRNDLADIDLDGDLDAVVAQENGDEVYWFEAPSNPTQTWTRHLIDNVAGEGFSMDVGDMDNDGDIDVVIGEHRGSGVNRVLIYENGKNSGPVSWTLHTADSGPTNVIDHHDGTQIFDMDDDGNNDIISISWYNKKVWLYENTSSGGSVPQVVALPAIYTLLLAD
jgi:hypothetical protein